MLCYRDSGAEQYQGKTKKEFLHALSPIGEVERGILIQIANCFIVLSPTPKTKWAGLVCNHKADSDPSTLKT